RSRYRPRRLSIAHRVSISIPAQHGSDRLHLELMQEVNRRQRVLDDSQRLIAGNGVLREPFQTDMPKGQRSRLSDGIGTAIPFLNQRIGLSSVFVSHPIQTHALVRLD